MNVLKSGFEWNTRSLFISDLFIHPGQYKTVVSANPSKDMVGLYRFGGIFATHEPVRKTVQKLLKLNPKLICPLDGSAFDSSCFQNL
ncbi:MAG: hypothetical protein M3M87_05980 [Thermoproteota archaeon]|nr:hypothetical protein [Thermoproteota archaeon]